MGSMRRYLMKIFLRNKPLMQETAGGAKDLPRVPLEARFSPV